MISNASQNVKNKNKISPASSSEIKYERLKIDSIIPNSNLKNNAATNQNLNNIRSNLYSTYINPNFKKSQYQNSSQKSSSFSNSNAGVRKSSSLVISNSANDVLSKSINSRKQKNDLEFEKLQDELNKMLIGQINAKPSTIKVNSLNFVPKKAPAPAPIINNITYPSKRYDQPIIIEKKESSSWRIFLIIVFSLIILFSIGFLIFWAIEYSGTTNLVSWF